MKDYSIQLYSVRDSMKTDFEGTLKAVSEMGYKSVEFAGFFGHSPKQINEILNKYNLKISGTHSSLADLIEKFDETVAFHKAIGNKNYIIPGIDLTSQEKIDYFVENANVLSEKLKKCGITMGFHNHAREFVINPDGSNPYDQIIYRTELMLEVDTYWAYVGMKNPLMLLDRLKDRVNFIHIKDGFADGHGMPLGMGEAPVKEVYEAALNASIPMVVESETLNPSGLREAEICINFLKNAEKQ